MTNRRSCCCSCFSCFSGRNVPSPASAPVDPANAPSPTEIVATGHQYPPSTSISGAPGKSIEPSFSASSSAVVVKQDDEVAGSAPHPSGGASCTPSAGASSIPSAPPPSAGSSSISSAPPPSAGASSSSTVPQTEGDNVEVDLDALIERISQRLELIKERKKPPQTKGAQQDWPTSSKTFFKLKEMLSEGINVVKDVIPGDTIKTAVKGVLQGMGTAHLVTAGLLVVANILERFEEVKANKDECRRLLSEMVFLAKVVKQFKERRELLNEGMDDIIKRQQN